MRNTIPQLWVLIVIIQSCGDTKKKSTRTQDNSDIIPTTVEIKEEEEHISHAKFSLDDCIDPDLNTILAGVVITLCDGSEAEGRLEIDASLIKKDEVIAGVVGIYTIEGAPYCTIDGEQNCINSGDFFAADTTAFSDSNIITGTQIAGVSGSASPSAAACSSDGSIGCLTVPSFPAAQIAGLSAKILTGQTVAGVNGSYTPDFPDKEHVLSSDTVNGESGTLTLPAASNVLSGSGSFGIAGNGSTPSYSPDFPAISSVLESDTVNGTPGTVANCSTGGQVGCLTTTSFKSVTMSGLEANIKNGVSIAGVTGTYPSAGNLLSGADSTADLSDNTGVRYAQLKSASSFEWFLPDGTRVSATGDSDIADPANILLGVNIFGTDGSASGGTPDPWDIRYGVVVGTTTGKLKMNCRNQTGSYDKTDGLATSGSDIYDSVDDYNGGGLFPSSNPWGSDAHFCGYNDPTDPTWELVSTSPSTGGNASVYLDKISQLMWTRGNSTGKLNWDDVVDGNPNDNDGALEYCDELGHGGITTWRLPTQKELQQAYVHGIYDLDQTFTTTDNLGNLNDWFWAASSLSGSPNSAWHISLQDGDMAYSNKIASERVLCVSE